MSSKASKGRFLKLDKLQNHTNEGKKKKKKRRKRDSEEEEKRRREKNNGYTLSLKIAFGQKKKKTVGRKEKKRFIWQ